MVTHGPRVPDWKRCAVRLSLLNLANYVVSKGNSPGMLVSSDQANMYCGMMVVPDNEADPTWWIPFLREGFWPTVVELLVARFGFDSQNDLFDDMTKTINQMHSEGRLLTLETMFGADTVKDCKRLERDGGVDLRTDATIPAQTKS